MDWAILYCKLAGDRGKLVRFESYKIIFFYYIASAYYIPHEKKPSFFFVTVIIIFPLSIS